MTLLWQDVKRHLAASNGTANAAGAASGFGQWVKLKHGRGITTVYGHISRWTITVGQAVHSGQLIALERRSGSRSEPPHGQSKTLARHAERARRIEMRASLAAHEGKTRPSSWARNRARVRRHR